MITINVGPLIAAAVAVAMAWLYRAQPWEPQPRQLQAAVAQACAQLLTLFAVLYVAAEIVVQMFAR